MKGEIHRKTKDGKLPNYLIREREECIEVGFRDGQYYSVICEVTDEDDAWEICDALNTRREATL